MDLRRISLWFAAALSSALPATAQACRDGEDQTPLLHRGVPELKPGLFVAEVEVISDYRKVGHLLDVRIISLVQGNYRGETVNIDARPGTSCDTTPSLGARGFIVGRLKQEAGTAMLVDLVRAPSINELAAAIATNGIDPTEFAKAIGEFTGESVEGADVRRVSCAPFKGIPTSLNCRWQQRRGRVWKQVSNDIEVTWKGWRLVKDAEPDD